MRSLRRNAAAAARLAAPPISDKSSNSPNARPRPPEILVEGATYRVIRKRETYEDLIRGE